MAQEGEQPTISLDETRHFADQFELERAAARLEGMPSFPETGTGSVIDGRYEVEGLLGHGGMGRVLRVKDRATLLPYALKLIIPTYSELIRASFESEFETISRLRHPGIPAALGYGFHRVHDAEYPYLVLELIPGETFGEYFSGFAGSESKDISELCQALADLVQTLDYLHSQRLVHRDIKPDNLKIVRGAAHLSLRLLDFGITSPIGPLQSAARAGSDTVCAGTLRFMAPELIAEQPLTPACDLYSVGVLLYATLCGRYPFEAPTPHGLIVRILRYPPPPLDELSVPPPLRDLAMRLLVKDPDQRPDAREILRALSELTGQSYDAGRRTAIQAQIASCPMIGRDGDLDFLLGSTALAEEGSGQVQAVVGGAGIGKSRLLGEVAVQLQLQGRPVLTGVVYEHTVAPYEWLLPPLRALLAQSPADLVAAFEPSLSTLVPEQVSPALASGGLLPDEIYADASRFLLTAATRQRAVLFFENLHWLDSDSLHCLRVLVRLAPEHRCLLVLVGRDGPWTECLGAVRPRELRPIEGDLLHSMLSRILLQEAPPALLGFVRRCGARSPFEIINLVQAAVLSDVLVREGSVWRFDGDAAESLPHEMPELLRLRLAALPETDLQLLLWLAVLERPTRISDLETLLGAAMDDSVQSVSRHGWIDLVADGQQRLLRTAHDLIGETCLSMLDEHLLADLHRQAGEHFAAQPEEQGEDVRAASHLERAGLFQQARALYQMGARRLLERQMTSAACQAWQQAFDLAGRTGELEATLREDAEACVEGLVEICRFDACRALLESWQRLIPRDGPESAAAWLARGECERAQGDMETARSSLERALALFTALEHHRGVGRTLNQLADCDRFSGDLPSAISRNRKALSIFTQIGDRAGQAYAWSALGSCTYRLFHFVEAAGHHRKALELYRWLRHRRGEGYAALGLGECARMQWKHDEASHFLGMARRLFRAVDDRRGEATTLCWLGAVATTQERFDEARSFFEEGLRLVAEIGNPNGQGEILLEYGHCESFAGNPEAALGRYRDCAEIFTTLGQSADAARATRGRARTHLLSGDFEAALRLLEEGLETEDGEWPDHAEVFTWLTVLDTAFGGSTAGRVFLAQGFERVPGRVELLLLADLRRSLRQPVPPRSPHSPDHLGFEARLLTALDDEGTVPSLHQAKTRRDRSAWHCHLRGDLEACRATRSVASPWYVYACLHERLIPYSMLPLRPSEIAEVTRRLTLVADRLDLNHQASGGAPG